jgi:cobalt-zinc-cadmium efflux system outer membrane protein
VGPADLLIAQTEVDDARAQLAPARSNLVVAEAELRRVLGLVGCLPELLGCMEAPMPPGEACALEQAALDQRADLRAHVAAVDEAQERLNLTVAGRWGNPAVGPAYQVNETSVRFVGVQAVVPLPLLNTHRGDIQQREAELSLANSELTQVEVQVQQDVQAAIARLGTALAGVSIYETQVVPNLRTAIEGLNKIIALNPGGVDVLKIVDLHRKLLRSRDGQLDAVWEAVQAQADLAGAVGDPALATAGCHADPQQPATLPSPSALPH